MNYFYLIDDFIYSLSKKVAMYQKTIATDQNLRRHFYDADSFRVFLEELACPYTKDSLVAIAGWCNYLTGQIVLAKSATHTAVRLDKGLSFDNVYPFSLFIIQQTKDVSLVYGGTGFPGIPQYLKPMIDHMISEYIIVPAGLKIVASGLHCIQVPEPLSVFEL